MMCSRSARPAPVLRSALGVRIDLISPSVEESSLRAAQPTSNSSFHAVQKVTSDALSLFASKAKTLSGGVSSYMLRKCSSSRASTCARDRSSRSIRSISFECSADLQVCAYVLKREAEQVLDQIALLIRREIEIHAGVVMV